MIGKGFLLIRFLIFIFSPFESLLLPLKPFFLLVVRLCLSILLTLLIVVLEIFACLAIFFFPTLFCNNKEHFSLFFSWVLFDKSLRIFLKFEDFFNLLELNCIEESYLIKFIKSQLKQLRACLLNT